MTEDKDATIARLQRELAEVQRDNIDMMWQRRRTDQQAGIAQHRRNRHSETKGDCDDRRVERRRSVYVRLHWANGWAYPVPMPRRRSNSAS